MNKSAKEIINCQQDIKLGQSMEDELDAMLKKIKRKLQASTKYLLKYRRQGNLMTYFDYAIYRQNKIEELTKGCILPFSQNHKTITAVVYNTLLLNHIQPEVEKILRKNQNGFQRNQSTTSQILTICQIIEVVCAKNLEAILLFIDFFKALDSIYREKIEQMHPAYGFSKETVTAIMILYKKHESNNSLNQW